MWKHIFIIGLILTVIGGYVFWTSSRKQNIPQDTPSPIAVQQSPQPKTAAAVPHENAEFSEENKVIFSENLKQIMSEVFGDEVLEEEQPISPDAQKMLFLLGTPAYEAFVETDPTSLAAFYDFFASHGVPLDKNELFEEAQNTFEKHFPGESAEALEPRMRQALSDLFAERGGDLFVLSDFVTNEQYNAWGWHYFQTDSDAFIKWGADIWIRNYDPPPTEGPVSSMQGEPSDESLSDELPTAASETPHIPQNGDVPIEDNIDIDEAVKAEIRRVFLNPTGPEKPELPRVPRFEKILRDAFPPQRVKAAMQTLNRYESQDALRRLWKSDPEIATFFERFVQKSKKKDK